MPFLCPCQNNFTSLIAKQYQRHWLSSCYRPDSVLSCCYQHHFGGQVLEVPGHIRGKAAFEPKLSVTRVCFEFTSCWKTGRHSPVSAPADHLIIIWGPQSLNFQNKGNWGENSLKPQIVPCPLIYSANALLPWNCKDGLAARARLWRWASSFSSESKGLLIQKEWLRILPWWAERASPQNLLLLPQSRNQALEYISTLFGDWAPSGDWISCMDQP